MQNNDFIELLSKLSPEEINEYIKTHGKPPKVIPGIIYDKKIQTGQYNNN